MTVRGTAHITGLITAAILGVLFRIPALRIGLSPFVFCDESMWIDEVRRMILENTLITNEFRSGGMTLIPIVITTKLIATVSGSIPSETTVLLIGRTMLVVFGSAIPPILVARTVRSLGGKPSTEIIAAFAIALSPSLLAMSKFWYPDHHIVIWSSLFMHASTRALKTQEPTLNQCIQLGVALGFLISTKYTAVVFLASLPVLFLETKKIGQRDQLRTVMNLIKRSAITAVIAALTFLTINYSLVFQFKEFWSDFTFNLNNYSEDGGGIGSALFYIYYLIMAPFSLVGGFFVAVGAISVLRNAKRFLFAMFLPTALLITSLSRTGLTINRNVAVLYPFVVILFSFGVSTIANKIKPLRLGLVLSSLPFIFFGWESAIQVKSEIKGDSRVHAQEWATNNISVQETVGVNEFCSGVSPVSAAGIPAVGDPLMANGYKYYMFNSYWLSSLSDHYLSSRNQANYHFYRIRVHDLPLPFHDKTAITDLVPRGYEIVKRFSEGGPEMIVLAKSN